MPQLDVSSFLQLTSSIVIIYGVLYNLFDRFFGRFLCGLIRAEGLKLVMTFCIAKETTFSNNAVNLNSLLNL